ncbi:hypothetical protein SEA_JACOREN57_51 [Mycobacterium phage JacoRen57]|nr:hypothetical protein SEA_JACOREN57_51 [Mycobacterium phage JacoRen57]
MTRVYVAPARPPIDKSIRGVETRSPSENEMLEIVCGMLPQFFFHWQSPLSRLWRSGDPAFCKRFGKTGRVMMLT